jgi:NTP pyrophosphatase (non-canonical NTP hydrolase)
MSIYDDARRQWGDEAVHYKAIEECAELIHAVVRWNHGACSARAIAEEIADVGIMLEQLTHMHQLAPLIEDYRKAKLERLAQRIEEDKPWAK